MRSPLKTLCAAAATLALLWAGTHQRASLAPFARERWTRVAAEAKLTDVEVARDRRPAFVVTPPGTIGLGGRVPPNGRLHLALSIRPAGTTARVRIACRSAQRTEVLADEVSTGERWSEREIDLARFAGQDVEIDLAASGTADSVAFATPELLGSPSGAARPNVILYVVDCLRADHVGAYGYPRPTTPQIDRLAADGALIASVHACASWTKPAVGCLFTSLYPVSHGAQTIDDVLDPSRPTLAEAFQQAGYTTAAWVANPFVSANPFGLTRGFDRVVQTLDKQPKVNINDLPADAADITRSVVPWLERNAGKSFFLYLHSLDLHAEYRPRPPFTRLFVSPGRRGSASPLDLYDTELAYNDHEIGRLIAALKRLGLYDRTLIAVTADHGEEFGEHGFTRHGHTLYESLLHVPLVLKLPRSDARGTRIDALTSSLDIAPTLLDVAGVPAPPGFEGMSLKPALQGRLLPARSVVFAEQLSPKEVLYAARDARFKAIEQLIPAPAGMLFDLQADPREEHNLLPNVPEAAHDLRARLLEFLQLGQAGYHVALASADVAAPMTIEASTEGTIADVQRFSMTAGESFSLSPDRKRVTFAFTPGAAARHFVLRTEPADAPLQLRLSAAGRPLPVDAVALGNEARHPEGMPFTTGPAAVRVSVSEAAALLKETGPGVRVWYVSAPSANRKTALDPELEAKLRALGYIQ